MRHQNEKIILENLHFLQIWYTIFPTYKKNLTLRHNISYSISNLFVFLKQNIF